jgi:hypothetical protein
VVGGGVMQPLEFPKSCNFWLVHGHVTIQQIRDWRNPTLDETFIPETRSLWRQYGFGVWHLDIVKHNGITILPGVYGHVTEFNLFLIWPLVLGVPLTVWTAQFLARRVFRKRNRSGLCPKCGYDLRATPDRCPECGTIPEKAK